MTKENFQKKRDCEIQLHRLIDLFHSNLNILVLDNRFGNKIHMIHIDTNQLFIIFVLFIDKKFRLSKVGLALPQLPPTYQKPNNNSIIIHLRLTFEELRGVALA